MLIKRSVAEKMLLPFYMLIIIGAILIIFWYTGMNKRSTLVIVSGSFYISSPQDTAQAAPVFNRFLADVNPDLILIEELFTPTLNLLTLMHPDSIRPWTQEVSGTFNRILDRACAKLNFEVKFLNPWRIDILEARQQVWDAIQTSSKLRETVQFYSLVNSASNEIISMDSVLANPLSMNTVMFDKIMEFQASLFNKLFDVPLGLGAMNTYNKRLMNSINLALNATNARKVLIVCNATRKYWIVKALAARKDITIGQVNSLSKRAKRL